MTTLPRRQLLIGGAALAVGASLGAPPAEAAPSGQPRWRGHTTTCRRPCTAGLETRGPPWSP